MWNDVNWSFTTKTPSALLKVCMLNLNLISFNSFCFGLIYMVLSVRQSVKDKNVKNVKK